MLRQNKKQNYCTESQPPTIRLNLNAPVWVSIFSWRAADAKIMPEELFKRADFNILSVRAAGRGGGRDSGSG